MKPSPTPDARRHDAMTLLPLDAIPKHFGLSPDSSGQWADAGSLVLALHLHGDQCLAAAARHTELAVFSVPCNGSTSSDTHATLLHSTSSPDIITALAWVALQTTTHHPAPAEARHANHHATSSEHTHQSSLTPASTSSSQLPTTGNGTSAYLLVGTVLGYVQIHDSCGRLMLRQRLHSSPIVRIRLRTAGMGVSSSFGKPGDANDVTLMLADSIARLSCWDLAATLTGGSGSEPPPAAGSDRSRASAGSTASSHSAGSVGGAAHPGQSASRSATGFGLRASAWAALTSAAAVATGAPAPARPATLPGKQPALAPLPIQRWELPRGLRGCADVVCLGRKPVDLYSALQGVGPAVGGEEKLLFAAGGESPALCALEAQLHAGTGTLAMIQGLVSSLSSVTSTAVGMARAAGSRVVRTPGNLASGLRSLVLAPLFLSASGVSADAADSSDPYTVAVYDGPAAPQRADAAGMGACLRDEKRGVTSLEPAPCGSLMVGVDSLSRLLLVDGSSMGVIRMWKGYRDAQCGWLEVPHCWAQARLHRQRQRHQQRSAYAGAGNRRPGTAVAPAASAAAAAAPAAAGAGCARGLGTQRQPVVQQEGDGMASPPCCRCEGTGGRLQGGVPPQPWPCGRSVLMAVYAPRRQTVEVWQAQQGVRLLALTRVGAHCQLLPARRVLPGRQPGPSSSNSNLAQFEGAPLAPSVACCFLFDGAQGAVTDLAPLVRGQQQV